MQLSEVLSQDEFKAFKQGLFAFAASIHAMCIVTVISMLYMCFIADLSIWEALKINTITLAIALSTVTACVFTMTDFFSVCKTYGWNPVLTIWQGVKAFRIKL
ncbi:MAG: hypothetical protein VX730_08070 [Pseudomonadota bacterium]|nr:hypothetical protein [Pseudomonadota bacterium]